MEKIYKYNPDSCSYEEVQKPFVMHNLMLSALIITSLLFFGLTCYYHAENEKTLSLAPRIAKNCYQEVEVLRTELGIKQQEIQRLANQHFLMPQAEIANVIVSQNKNELLPVKFASGN